ncbi:MAG: hydroxymethylbilane synthase [Gemmatimonadales bacterium]|jgi:hydroxymethylbilane synthase
MPETLLIGSRKSPLARSQAEWVARLVSAAWPKLQVRNVWMDTEGDRKRDVPLPAIGGKGLFTAELEAAILDGEIDIAVHSLKDLPTDLPSGLALLAVPEREDPSDVLVSKQGLSLSELQDGARVGTSSLRRRALLLDARPDCRPLDVRGNVDTRLAKLERGDYEAILLAAAGLKRLGKLSRTMQSLEAPAWLPAPGQGALGIEGRADDERVHGLLDAIEDQRARAETDCERSVLAALGGGCQVPIGALALRRGDNLTLHAAVLSEDGSQAIRASTRGSVDDAVGLGRLLAEELRARGADKLLMSRAHGAGA